MKVIRKHPIALMFLIAFEFMGISIFMSVMENLQWDWQYAIVGLLMVVGAAIFAIATVAGIISLAVKSKKPKNYPVEAVREIAITYMSKTKFNAIYWIIVILMMPIWPVLFIHLLGYYSFGVLIMTFGIMVYMLAVREDAYLRKFYRIKNTDKYFEVMSGEDSDLLDSFYGDFVHVYNEEYWELDKPLMINLLKKENTLGKSVKCYKVAKEYLDKKYGFDYPKHYDNLILVPFSQFDINEKNGATLRSVLNCLSSARFTDVVNVKYTYKPKNSTEPAEYAETKEGIMLSPSFADITAIKREGSDVFVCMYNANDTENKALTYWHVLMVIKNAEFLSGDAEKEAKQMEMGYSSIICGFKIDEEKKTLSFMVMNDDEDAEYENEEEEAENDYVGFDYSYDSIQWYWDGVCDSSRTIAIIERIAQKPADK